MRKYQGKKVGSLADAEEVSLCLCQLNLMMKYEMIKMSLNWNLPSLVCSVRLSASIKKQEEQCRTCVLNGIKAQRQIV